MVYGSKAAASLSHSIAGGEAPRKGRTRVGEEFGGFDVAGGQVGDEFAVGEEEIVIGEFTGEDPGDLLECAGSDFRLGVLGGEEMDFEVLGRIGVPVADAGDGGGFNES